MYCIQCGVALSPGQTVCPLCGTRVYHPDIPPVEEKPTYPRKEFQSEELNLRGLLFVITILWLLPLILPLIFEYFVRHQITWSGIAAGGLLLTYIYLILPAWFRRGNPVVFIPCDTLIGLLYLGYLDYLFQGRWFFTFALPLAFSLGMLITVITALHRYVHRGFLFIYGGGVIALGAWTVLLELLIRHTFGISSAVLWSVFSFVSLFVLGLLLILIGIIKPWKESLYRIFFIGSLH